MSPDKLVPCTDCFYRVTSAPRHWQLSVCRRNVRYLLSDRWSCKESEWTKIHPRCVGWTWILVCLKYKSTYHSLSISWSVLEHRIARSQSVLECTKSIYFTQQMVRHPFTSCACCVTSPWHACTISILGLPISRLDFNKFSMSSILTGMLLAA